MLLTYSKKHLLVIIAIVIILLLAIPYLLGYRVGSGLHIERVGTLVLNNLPAGTSVYIDRSLHGTLKKAGNMHVELIGGDHAVIVSAPNDNPWTALVPIVSGKETVQQPIFVGLRPEATPLTDADRDTALSAIASTTLPTQSNPLKLGGCVEVYIENNQILASAIQSPGCTPPPYLCPGGTCEPTIVYSPAPPITSLFVYPNRQDALVLQLEDTLYALSLDPRTPQFFVPILTGTQPILGALPDGTIVVHTFAAVYTLTI